MLACLAGSWEDTKTVLWVKRPRTPAKVCTYNRTPTYDSTDFLRGWLWVFFFFQNLRSPYGGVLDGLELANADQVNVFAIVKYIEAQNHPRAQDAIEMAQVEL